MHFKLALVFIWVCQTLTSDFEPDPEKCKKILTMLTASSSLPNRHWTHTPETKEHEVTLFKLAICVFIWVCQTLASDFEPFS